MKKFIQRWYEKNENLRAFMALYKDLPQDIQCEIAVEIIVKASSLSDRDYTNIIKGIEHYNPKDFHRWYDKNPNLHCAIESLKDLSEEQVDSIISEFSEHILNDPLYSSYINLDDENETEE